LYDGYIGKYAAFQHDGDMPTSSSRFFVLREQNVALFFSIAKGQLPSRDSLVKEYAERFEMPPNAPPVPKLDADAKVARVSDAYYGSTRDIQTGCVYVTIVVIVVFWYSLTRSSSIAKIVRSVFALHNGDAGEVMLPTTSNGATSVRIWQPTTEHDVWLEDSALLQSYPYFVENSLQSGVIRYATFISPIFGLEPVDTTPTLLLVYGLGGLTLLLIVSCCCMWCSCCVRALRGETTLRGATTKSSLSLPSSSSASLTSSSVPLLSAISDDDDDDASEVPPPPPLQLTPTLDLEAALLSDDDDDQQSQSAGSELLVDNVEAQQADATAAATSDVPAPFVRRGKVVAADHVALHRRLMSERGTHHLAMFACCPLLFVLPFAYFVAMRVVVPQLAYGVPSYMPAVLALPFLFATFTALACGLATFVCIKRFWPIERRVCFFFYIMCCALLVALFGYEQLFFTQCWHG
jgi:hypothetical protein